MNRPILYAYLHAPDGIPKIIDAEGGRKLVAIELPWNCVVVDQLWPHGPRWRRARLDVVFREDSGAEAVCITLLEHPEAPAGRVIRPVPGGVAISDEARPRFQIEPGGDGYHLIIEDDVVIARSRSRKSCERIVAALSANPESP